MEGREGAFAFSNAVAFRRGRRPDPRLMRESRGAFQAVTLRNLGLSQTIQGEYVQRPRR